MSKSPTRQRIAQISAILCEIRPPAPPVVEVVEYNKKCGKCGAYLPRLPEYWCKRYKRGKVYMTSPCRACYSLARKLKQQPPRKPVQIAAAKQRRTERNQQLQAQRIAAAKRNRQIVEEFRKTLN